MENAYLIIPYDNKDEEQEKIRELTALANTAGANVVGVTTLKINRIVPSTYIGSGTIENIRLLAESEESNLVIFDGDLSPSQTLNLSSALGDIKVIDRTTLILDIFALNAKTSEGKVQVELAQLKYIYPRLKGKGSALSRLGGGIGTRGPGETKLESDRRHIRRKINLLEQRLDELQKRRELQASRRAKNENLQVALVGYTNTGKSTLLNALTGSEVLAEDKLFATLDPTTRKLNLGEFSVLLSDTVGFIKNVPTSLIEAFKSTLETAVNSDLILIVCDATSDWMAQLETTNLMLDELNAKATRITVFNKCENIKEFDAYPNNAVFISAKHNMGLQALLRRISAYFSDNYKKIELDIAYEQLNNFYKAQKYVEHSELIYNDECVKVKAVIANIHMDTFNKIFNNKI